MSLNVSEIFQSKCWKNEITANDKVVHSATGFCKWLTYVPSICNRKAAINAYSGYCKN